MLLEDALRVPGVLLEQATEMVDNAFRNISGESVPESSAPVAAQNTTAMAELQSMMAGIKR